jgi:glycosyltransferase involved in cell wall biosynthesis
MRVLIDTGKLKDLYSGLGQVSLEYGKALASLADKQHQFTYIVPRNSKGIFGDDVAYISDSPMNRLLLKFSAHKQFDLVHYPYQQFKLWLHPARLPFILTIHDFNFFYTKTEAKAQFYLAKLVKKVKRAAAIAAISDFTVQEIRRYIPALHIPVTRIYNGVRLLVNIEEEATEVKQPFLFSIGVMHPKKNFEALIGMMKYLPGHILVIAGGGNRLYAAKLQQLAAEQGIANRVIFTGYVTDAQKKWLYQNCEAFVFASAAEGFGLPVIEAMQFGKPVFLTHQTSLPEIGSSLAAYWHNTDALEMSKVLVSGIDQYRKDTSLPGKMKVYAAGFSWQKNAEAYLAFYQHVLTSSSGKGP